MGYFDLTADQVRAHFTEPTFLNAHFLTLGETTLGSFEAQSFVGAPELSVAGVSYPDVGGCFAASVIFTPASNVAAIDGMRCYVWAMNASTVAGASEHGIFSDATWVLHPDGFGAALWDLSQVSSVDANDVLLGNRGPQTSLIVGGTVLRLTNTSQLQSDAADIDHDGASGLLEAAFLMDPNVPDSPKLPQILIRNGQACLEFQRKSGGIAAADGSYIADGLRYIVEVSENLHAWHPHNATDAATLTVLPSAAPGAEMASLQLRPSSIPAGSQFARVRVERIE
jgi:hypothetical protein